MERDVIEPMVVHGVGECFECGGQIVVVDMETTFMTLSSSGSPVSEDTMIKCEGVCQSCKRRIPMLRDGMNYIIDNDYNRFLKRYRKEINDQEIAYKMEALKPKEDNPFCITIKGEK